MMQKLTVALVACVFACGLSACEEGKKAVNAKRKEIANEVGGAPKRTIDNVTKRTNAAMAKGMKRLKEAEAEANQ